jgi:hypothetical protein
VPVAAPASLNVFQKDGLDPPGLQREKLPTSGIFIRLSVGNNEEDKRNHGRTG